MLNVLIVVIIIVVIFIVVVLLLLLFIFQILLFFLYVHSLARGMGIVHVLKGGSYSLNKASPFYGIFPILQQVLQTFPDLTPDETLHKLTAASSHPMLCLLNEVDPLLNIEGILLCL